MELIKIIFGLMVCVAIASSNNHDPSPFNLLSPQGGINNYLGLPGALFAGLLKDVFGQMAILVPMFMIFVGTKNIGISWKTAMLMVLELFLLVTLISFMFMKSDSALLKYTGLWGYISNISLAEPSWRNASLIIVFGYQILFFRLFRLNPIVLVVFIE
ncbi:DNA translocase FtsK 4TM domain-containing protein, partial [bacterium]|nr:DNA translocase FtsK 4TM domain-containing protein [bacterium]